MANFDELGRPFYYNLTDLGNRNELLHNADGDR